MDFKGLLTWKRAVFVAVFSVLAFVGYQINFSAVVGVENQAFTLFQFFGPMAGAFLGPVFGAAAVLLAQVGNYLVLGKAFDAIGLLRLAPMLFAAYYFGTKAKEKLGLAPKLVLAEVSLLCMMLFILHPVGHQVWFFSLYWLIPIALAFAGKNPVFRALGATFTAHAVGSTLWLYTIPMPAEVWVGLVPVVAFERLVFAAGIVFSYIAMNTLLSKVEAVSKSGVVSIDPKYVLSAKMLKA